MSDIDEDVRMEVVSLKYVEFISLVLVLQFKLRTMNEVAKVA